MICPGHKISPDVREYFHVRHVLTEEVSIDGRIRVNVKTSAKDEVMDKINRQKRYVQLVFGDYDEYKTGVKTQFPISFPKVC